MTRWTADCLTDHVIFLTIPAMGSQIKHAGTRDRFFVEGGLVLLLDKFLQQRGLRDPTLEQMIARNQNRRRLPLGRWCTMLKLTQSLCPEPALGLQIGALIEPAHAGVIGYLVSSSRNLGEALLNFERFQRLVYEGNPGKLKNDGKWIKLEWGTEYGVATQLIDETAMAAFISFNRRVSNRPNLSPSKVEFINPRPKKTTPYERFFNCPVVFDAPVTSVQFPVSLLAVGISSEDSNLHHLLSSQAVQMLSQLPSQNHFEQQLLEVILRSLHSGQAKFEVVANDMHLSPRTLHRRLSDHGLEFKTLLLNMRKQLSQQYLLDTHLSLTEIALLLSYSEPSAFSRAFKRWFNESPKQFRASRAATNSRLKTEHSLP